MVAGGYSMVLFVEAFTVEPVVALPVEGRPGVFRPDNSVPASLATAFATDGTLVHTTAVAGRSEPGD